MQAASSLVTFDQFVADYPAQANQRYELHRGIIVEMPKPKGKHSKIAGFINGTLFLQIQAERFRDNDVIRSGVFPDLQLTVAQIFAAGRSPT